jgi:hypothetical protein
VSEFSSCAGGEGPVTEATPDRLRRTLSPLGAAEVARVYGAAGGSFGAREATRLRQGFGVVNGCMDYFGARD